jgi:hypothetical protein
VTDALPKLVAEIEYLLREGASYALAPNLGCDVLDRIDTFLGRFVAYPDRHARHAHTLWIAHTWLMDVWDHTPRLLLVSPEAGSGKTRALSITACLVPRPDHVGDLTPAAFFHAIDESLANCGARPTILFDELDTVFGNAEEGRIRDVNMRRLLDIGHDRNATIKRTVYVKGQGRQTIRFQAYTAVALAGKMDAYDVPATIRTRSVVIAMQRRLPEEKIERFERRAGAAAAQPLRELLQLWVELVHGHADEHRGVALPEGITDRDADVWAPLLAVADLAGGHWPALARVAAVASVAGSGVNATPSEGVQLLWAIRAIFDERQVSKIFTEDLLADLRGRGEFSWATRPLVDASLKLAKLLSAYRIVPASQRIGQRAVRGYRRDYFEEAWRRYPLPATPATPATEDDGDGDE